MLETVFTGIGSFILSLIGYFYNSWRMTVKTNRKIYLQYIWRLTMNQRLLEQMKAGNLALESGSSLLQCIEPYTIRYIPIFDDQLSKDLLNYNLLILKPMSQKGILAEDIEHLLSYTDYCLQQVNGMLSFIDNVIGKLCIPSFLCYLSLPFIINKIAKTYLPDAGQHKRYRSKNQ